MLRVTTGTIPTSDWTVLDTGDMGLNLNQLWVNLSFHYNTTVQQQWNVGWSVSRHMFTNDANTKSGDSVLAAQRLNILILVTMEQFLTIKPF